MDFDTSLLRPASEVPAFPYADHMVTLVHVDAAGKVASGQTLAGKVAILRTWREGELLLASWAGPHRVEMFAADHAAAAAAVKMPPGPPRLAPPALLPSDRLPEEWQAKVAPLVEQVLSGSCRQCEAPPGVPCRTPTGVERRTQEYHRARLQDTGTDDAMRKVGVGKLYVHA
ncbi:hypothetical protein [Streptomyces sp. NBC_00207]|uniref:hypothetical protein n=1 Tax=unclassified Streptomyces TaxID=2593676 RepID=UPI002885023C|nr:hypothetical protein [Streptomyces sp. DSM 41633]